MIEMCLVHNDYDRISDKVMWLSNNAILYFNVDLFNTRKDIRSNQRVKENFHKEVIYKTEDGADRVKINRNFNYYFTIEYNSKDIKDKVFISQNDIYFVIFNLEKILKWFMGEDGVSIFAKDKSGKLFILNKQNPIRINLQNNRMYIEFEPCISSDMNGYDTVGVRVFLNNDSTFFFMNSNTLFSLYHMLSSCNMYSLALSVLNYMGRPEYGTNAFNMNTHVVYNNKSSFFDRVGAKNIESKDPPVG